MKAPLRPPGFADAFAALGAARRRALLAQAPRWWPADTHLAWDELRLRPPPRGFTVREWWLGLQLGRRARSRLLPLTDGVGAAFRYALPDALLALLHGLDRGLDAAAATAAPALAEPALWERTVAGALRDEAIASAQLAGATTPHAAAKELLRTGRPPRDASERMIQNLHRALLHLRDGRDEPLTPAAVLALHWSITEGTLDDAAVCGRLRPAGDAPSVKNAGANRAWSAPPPAEDLPARLAALCAFANGGTPDHFVPPVVRAMTLAFWLAHDRPFVDGNGRTARALYVWALWRQGHEVFAPLALSPAGLRAPERHAAALRAVADGEGDLTPFLLWQAGVIKEALAALGADVQRKTAEPAAAPQVFARADLNPRQQALLAHALREPATRYVIVAHQRSHNVTHQTARDDLFDLVQRGLLTVRRDGRSYVFLAPADLAARLGQPAEPLPTVAPVAPVALPPSLTPASPEPPPPAPDPASPAPAVVLQFPFEIVND
ncbi:MAG: Fic family protein [Opitutae bacterium]|nr:Fic family protein [Opitutae bacterium]